MLALVDGLTQRAGRDIRRRIDGSAERLRGSYGRILSLVPPGGARPSDLAEGWVTRQAVGARIKEMEGYGWVRTQPDPSDGRAVLVYLTASGRRMRDRGHEAIAVLEHEWAQLVGEERYDVFRTVLEELAGEVLPPPPRGDEPPAGKERK